MAVKPRCDTHSSQVTMDVRNKEFLRYEVSFKGAKAEFSVTDEEKRKILDERATKKDGVFVAEWPPEGGWVWDGADTHQFVGILALAESYRVLVTYCGPGFEKVIRDCTFKATRPSDVAFHRLSVFVKKEQVQ